MRSSLSDPASPSTLNSQGVTVSLMLAERGAPRPQTPEDTVRAAGIDDRRQATYQRRLSALLAGRAKAGT